MNALQTSPLQTAPPSPLATTNALASTTGKPAAAQGQMFNVAQNVQARWEAAQAQHKQLLDQAQRVDASRRELDTLGKLGDSIEVEDVIKGAGTLVGSGFSPMALASMLSSMPTTGGQALQAWVAQQEQRVSGIEQQMRQQLKDSSIHRGIAAMSMLHIQHIRNQNGAGRPRPPPMMGVGGGQPQEAPMEDQEEQ
jgi:hypothetical protein